jgi:hypothetical protein
MAEGAISLRGSFVVPSHPRLGSPLVAAKRPNSGAHGLCRHGLCGLLLTFLAPRNYNRDSRRYLRALVLVSQFLQLLDLWASGSWMGRVGIIWCCSCCVVIYLRVGGGEGTCIQLGMSCGELC